MTDELARGELVELLPEHRPEVMPIHLIYPPDACSHPG